MRKQPTGGEGSEDGPFCLQQGVIVVALMIGVVALALYFFVWRGHPSAVKTSESNIAANSQ
jgi:hypothetical protein